MMIDLANVFAIKAIILPFLLFTKSVTGSTDGKTTPSFHQPTMAKETGTPNEMDGLVCIADFYEAAKIKLTPSRVWEHIEGGVDDEFAVSENRKAYRRYAIRPRFLRNLSNISLTTTILGKPVPFPVGVAPTGFHKMVHPEGECATAKGAGGAGSIFVLSITSSRTLEDVAKAAKDANTRIWFQQEMLQDNSLNLDLLKRAEIAGFEAVVLTVDAQFHGKHRPSLRHPVHFGNENETNQDLASFVPYNNSDPFVHDTSVTWDVVAWIRQNTKMKLVVKGILTAEDAAIAAGRGVDAIIVSNHGGRMLDCTLPTIDALSEVVAAVPKGFEVYLDGGVMLGSDVFKALALGAKMVFVGRAPLWGLAVGGEQGVSKVLETYKSELTSIMGLSGVANVNDINSKCLQKYSPM